MSHPPGRLFGLCLGVVAFLGPLAVHIYFPVIPAVKAAFERQGKILKAEAVTKGTTVTYEGSVDKNGKRTAVGPVDANGQKAKR